MRTRSAGLNHDRCYPLSKRSKTSLFQLPDEIWSKIAKRLSLKDHIHLSYGSKRFYAISVGLDTTYWKALFEKTFGSTRAVTNYRKAFLEKNETALRLKRNLPTSSFTSTYQGRLSDESGFLLKDCFVACDEKDNKKLILFSLSDPSAKSKVLMFPHSIDEIQQFSDTQIQIFSGSQEGYFYSWDCTTGIIHSFSLKNLIKPHLFIGMGCCAVRLAPEGHLYLFDFSTGEAYPIHNEKDREFLVLNIDESHILAIEDQFIRCFPRLDNPHQEVTSLLAGSGFAKFFQGKIAMFMKDGDKRYLQICDKAFVCLKKVSLSGVENSPYSNFFWSDRYYLEAGPHKFTISRLDEENNRIESDNKMDFTEERQIVSANGQIVVTEGRFQKTKTSPVQQAVFVRDFKTAKILQTLPSKRVDNAFSNGRTVVSITRNKKKTIVCVDHYIEKIKEF